VHFELGFEESLGATATARTCLEGSGFQAILRGNTPQAESLNQYSQGKYSGGFGYDRPRLSWWRGCGGLLEYDCIGHAGKVQLLCYWVKGLDSKFIFAAWRIATLEYTPIISLARFTCGLEPLHKLRILVNTYRGFDARYGYYNDTLIC
jgi:hypothetical protein